MLEKDFEDIICKYPELIEDDLKLIDRQLTIYGRRIDLLFEDRFKRKLIVELKAGPIKDEHTGQILSYEGTFLSDNDPTIRVMLIGTRVPPNLQKSLDHHGIAWKEINFSFLKGFLKGKGDETFNHLFEYEEPFVKERVIHSNNNERQSQIKFESAKPGFGLIERFKSSISYESFKEVLPSKISYEAEAKKTIQENLGHIEKEHLKKVIDLIDYPHPVIHTNGKPNRQPWFNSLFSKPNTKNLFNENNDKINRWFEILSDNNIPVEIRIDKLLTEPYRIKGLSVGSITLMLYILDKTNYSIWLEALHDGLKLIYPELDKFYPKGKQYLIFNDLAKQFRSKYNFEHTELDYVLSQVHQFI
jgi:hypothetical protein